MGHGQSQHLASASTGPAAPEAAGTAQHVHGAAMNVAAPNLLQVASEDGELPLQWRGSSTHVVPAWPGRPYRLACPLKTPQTICDRLSSEAAITGSPFSPCWEPEPETMQVLNAMLSGCPGGNVECLYVDVGCNIGHFAAQAAALNATVNCYEPTPFYARALEASRQLNHWPRSRWGLYQHAVVPIGFSNRSLTFDRAYSPCGIGADVIKSHLKSKGPWQASTISIDKVLRGKRVNLLNMDIDANEGELLQDIANLVERGETAVDSILAEIGDNAGPKAWCARGKANYSGSGCRGGERSLRGASLGTIRQLMNMGYNVYRMNIHTGREIFDWRGKNANPTMAPEPQNLVTMFGVRGIRKLEWLLPSHPLDPNTFLYGTSFLFTRQQLATLATHSKIDLRAAKVPNTALNVGNPSHLRGP